MASGTGVTVTSIGAERWRLRWRERKADGGWRSRETVFTGRETGTDGAEGYALLIRTALRDHGTFDPAAHRRVVEADARPPATLLDMMEACIVARIASGKYRKTTPKTYRSYKVHVAEAIHAIEGIPEDQPLPVTLLRRELFDIIQTRAAGLGLGSVMRYAPVSMLLDHWSWAHDANMEARTAGRPDPWPGLPPAPASRKDYKPRAPKHGRTVAPTMTHMDACLRRLPEKASRSTRIYAIFARYTGLRSGQILGIHREDIDLTARTLFVRVTKTEAEELASRTVPLSRQLLNEPGVGAWLAATAAGPIFAHAWEHRARLKPPAKTLRTAWEAATAANEVPEHVWKPRNRVHSRPDHAFRAGFQAALVDARVEADVIDYLVGHAPADVRGTHYGRDLDERARAAVDALPPIDWTGPEASSEASNVVQLVRPARS